MSTELDLVQMRSHAEVAAAALARLPEIAAVALFGSVARGTGDLTSDIDLLVLVSHPTVSASGLLEELPSRLRGDEFSLSVFTAESLGTYLHTWSRFAAHLRIEGEVLHDPDGVRTALLAQDIEVSVEKELEAQADNLENFAHLERFGGRLLFH